VTGDGGPSAAGSQAGFNEPSGSKGGVVGPGVGEHSSDGGGSIRRRVDAGTQIAFDIGKPVLQISTVKKK
jgi:hypothetical protein